MKQSENTRGARSDHPDEASREHKRRVIHEWIIPIITGAVTLISVWPSSHGIALLLAATIWIVTIPVQLALVSRGRLQLAVSISAVIVAVCAGVYVYLGPNRIPEEQKTEVLIPGMAPTPPNACDELPKSLLSSTSTSPLTILIGDNAFIQTGADRLTAIQVGACPVLSMWRTPIGITVESDLFNAQGKLVASVRDGKLMVLTSDDIKMSRNGDLSTLVVSDAADNELLFVQYLNPTTIIARGVFGCPGHKLVRVRSDEPVPGLTLHHSCMANNKVGIQIN